jgi:hypothetical protein
MNFFNFPKKTEYAGYCASLTNNFFLYKRGCPALGIWVAFLKQPDALPGRAHPKNKNYIFFNYF